MITEQWEAIEEAKLDFGGLHRAGYIDLRTFTDSQISQAAWEKAGRIADGLRRRNAEFRRTYKTAKRFDPPLAAEDFYEGVFELLEKMRAEALERYPLEWPE